MSLRELNRRLDKVEARAKTKRLGILPIITEIDFDAIENWETLTPEEREQVQAKLHRPETVSMRSTDPLAAIVVRVHLPDEDELWRLDDGEPRIEPETDCAEPA